MSRYGVFSAVFSSNVGKYGTEKIPNLDTFHAVIGYDDWIVKFIDGFCLYFVVRFFHYLLSCQSLYDH